MGVSRRASTAIAAAAVLIAIGAVLTGPSTGGMLGVPSAVAAGGARTPYPTSGPAEAPQGLDAATARAARLQKDATDAAAEMTVIQARIRATTAHIYRQAAVLEQTEAREASAQAAFDERVVGIYKAGSTSPLELLLSAPSFGAALERGAFLLSIVDEEKQALEQAVRLSSDAAYQAHVLEDLRAQDVGMREYQDTRIRAIQNNLALQRQIVTSLTLQQRAYLAARAAADAAQRKSWADSSYLGPAKRVAAAVEQYPGVPYLVDEGEPTSYRALDPPRTAVCSWYGNADNAPTPTSTASGRKFNENEFTCASRTLPFGTRLALTYGGNHIIVVVTDRGPYVAGRQLDLSKSAAHTLGFDGVEAVSVQTVVAAK